MALVIGLVVHGLSVYARCIPPALFATPPVWAWIAEWRLGYRLERRVAAVDGATVRSVSSSAQLDLPGR